MNRLNEITPFVGDSVNYVYDGSDFEHRIRVCNVFAFHLFTDGPGVMEVEGKRYPIDRRTLVFIKPNQPHAFHIHRTHPLASYNVYMDMWDRAAPVSQHRAFIHAPEVQQFSRVAEQAGCEELDQLPCVFSLLPYPSLYDSFVNLTQEYQHTSYYREEIVNHLMYSWMLSWYNVVCNRQPRDYRIVKLLAALHERPEERQHVDSWAAMCGLKKSYFHALFLKETGLTPKAYHHRLLMRQAAMLLKDTDLSVTGISDRLGYPSIHPFTRHFSSYYGASPTKYRNGHLEQI